MAWIIAGILVFGLFFIFNFFVFLIDTVKRSVECNSEPSCPKGEFALKGAECYSQRKTCKTCPMDYFNDQENQLQCQSCAPGKTTFSCGSQTCEPCDEGYSMSATTGKCYKCSAGKYMNIKSYDWSPAYAATRAAIEKNTCKMCAKGQYNDKPMQSSCQPCPQGRYSNTEGSSKCKKCGKSNGKYTYANKEIGADGCADCLDNPMDADCPNGSPYLDPKQCGEKQVQCHPCPTGTYLPVNMGTCLACTKGSYSGVPGAVACDPCDDGWYQSEHGASACQICEPGTFSKQSTDARRNVRIGASECQVCEPNHYTTRSGMNRCTPCSSCAYQPGTVCHPATGQCVAPETIDAIYQRG